MYKIILILTFLSILHQSQSAESFHVSINADANKDYSGARCMGTIISNITDKIKNIWQIQDSKMKKYLEATTLNDGVARFSFTSSSMYVVQVLSPARSRVKSLKAAPTIVTQNSFSNEFSENVTYSANLIQSITTTVTTTYSGSEQFSGDYTVKAEVNVGVFSGGAALTTGIASTFGKENTKEEVVTIGASAGVLINLGPGEKATAAIKADQGKLETEITFDAFLAGNVFVEYKPGQLVDKEEIDILDVLFFNDIPLLKRVKLHTVVDFFSDISIDVNPADLNTKISKEAALLKKGSNRPMLPPSRPKFKPS